MNPLCKHCKQEIQFAYRGSTRAAFHSDPDGKYQLKRQGSKVVAVFFPRGGWERHNCQKVVR